MLGLRTATAKDLLRRPSTRLALVAAAALVALIPHMPAPGASERDQVRLTLELGTTTAVLVVQMFAGVTAVYASTPDGDRGLSPEMLAAPRSRGSTTVARLFGTLQVAAVALALLVVTMMITWVPTGIGLEAIAQMGPPLGAAVVGATAFAALGLALGRAFRPDLAVLLVVLLPWLPPACAATNAPPVVAAALTAVLPPIAGPIHARPYAFGGETATLADLLSILATLIQALAWTVLAASAPTRSMRGSTRSS